MKIYEIEEIWSWQPTYKDGHSREQPVFSSVSKADYKVARKYTFLKDTVKIIE